MKQLILFVSILMFSTCVYAQDTIRVDNTKPSVLPSANKVYIFIPSDTATSDSIVVVNSKAYFKLIQDKQTCKTFISLYQLYKQKVGKGDVEVQGLIESYEVIIKTKDSSYTVLMEEYYTLNGLLSSSINQTEEAILISKNTLDTLSLSLKTITAENKYLRADLTSMKQQNNKNKWRYGLVGLAAGIFIGILLIH